MTSFGKLPPGWLRKQWDRLFPANRARLKRRGPDAGTGIRLAPPEKLEVPEGIVPPESPFYVERKADEEIRGLLSQGGTIATLHGAHQSGKTSLLVRAVKYAFHQGLLAIYVDASTVFDEAPKPDLDQVLRHVARAIAVQARVSAEQIRSAWHGQLSPTAKMTGFFENLLLDDAERPISLIIDQADIVMETSFCSELFGLFRAWHNRRVFDARWEKLNIVLAISVHPSLLISDITQSPFNVGVQIKLDDFSEAQVRALNEKHGSPIRPKEISEAMSLLGGHPYLIRKALYTLVNQGITWPELDAIAAASDGPFGAHLVRTLRPLADPKMEQAVRKILRRKRCPQEELFSRLESARLVKRQGRKCICRYQLYDRFYRSQLR